MVTQTQPALSWLLFSTHVVLAVGARDAHALTVILKQLKMIGAPTMVMILVAVVCRALNLQHDEQTVDWVE